MYTSSLDEKRNLNTCYSSRLYLILRGCALRSTCTYAEQQRRARAVKGEVKPAGVRRVEVEAVEREQQRDYRPLRRLLRHSAPSWASRSWPAPCWCRSGTRAPSWARPSGGGGLLQQERPACHPSPARAMARRRRDAGRRRLPRASARLERPRRRWEGSRQWHRAGRQRAAPASEGEGAEATHQPRG
jgi:hypothetical protein